MAKGRLIEVALSEAQWATFVSSMNVGSGVQCTLRWKAGEGWLPEIDLPTERRSQFLGEMVGQFKDALAELAQMRKDIQANKSLSQKAKDALLHHIHRAESGMGARGDHSGLGWVERQFDEHMETTVEKAKIEVNAYLTATLHRAGIAALRIRRRSYRANRRAEMSDLITVNVTAEDLACGWGTFISPAPTAPDRRACGICPVEHALTRAVGEPVQTEGQTVWLARNILISGTHCVPLPSEAKDAVKRIDIGLPVQPFTFEIERPR